MRKLIPIFCVILLILCQSTYSLNCTENDPNCFSCVSPLNSSSCATCVQNYQLYQSTCIQCNINDCTQCQKANVCSVCASNFTLLNNECIQCSITNCQVCLTRNYCGTCKTLTPAIFPNANGDACVQCTVNSCLKCSKNNSCAICDSNKYLYPQIAVDGVSQRCFACRVDNCQSCSADNFCQTCNLGFQSLANGNCFICGSPCATCFNNGTCQTCQSPLYYESPNTNGDCFSATVSQCATYNLSNTTQCLSCVQTYLLNSTSNKCYSACTSPCLDCTGSLTSCTSCQVGFYLRGSTCIQCAVGCKACTASACTQAMNGFYVKNGEVNSCRGYCLVCTSADDCSQLKEDDNNVGKTLFHDGDGNSLVAKCAETCKKCSSVNPQLCIVCQQGYALSSGICQPCNIQCRTCLQTSVSTCTNCYPKSFFSTNTCVKCNENCLDCVGASQPNVCITCRQDYYLQGTVCVKGCPTNCISCSNGTTCIKCSRGYTVFKDTQFSPAQYVCAQCLTNCLNCASNRPTVCLQCGQGFYLDGTLCKACSSMCLSCSVLGCSTCNPGYYVTVVTDSLGCVLNCVDPCSTCQKTNPATCLSCIAGYLYDSTKKACTPTVNCNGKCQVCPMGYTLDAGNCLKCLISNCQSCSASNTTLCYSCLKSSYLSDNTCVKCDASCATCLSSSVCLTCADGYTYTASSASGNGYICLKCTGRCLNCYGQTAKCTSCITGYSFNGWKCTQDFKFLFGVTFLTDIDTFNSQYKKLESALKLAVSSTNPESVSFIKVTQGSVILQGQVQPTSGTNSAQSLTQFQNLGTSLANNAQLAGMKVGGSSLSVQGGSIGVLDLSSSSSIGLILGICIPIGILVAVGATLFIVYKKKKADKYDRDVTDKGYSSEKSETEKAMDDNSLI